MSVSTFQLPISSRSQLEVIDITPKVSTFLRESGILNGTVTVFCPGSTGAISTLEFEPGLQKDIPEFFSELVPYTKNWKHHQTWGDDNGSGHILSFLLGSDFTVPVVDGKMTLGTWQQIVFCECDTRPRNRKLVVQIVGE